MAAAGPVMGKYTPILMAAAAGTAAINKITMIRANRLMVRPPLLGKRPKGMKEFTPFRFSHLSQGRIKGCPPGIS
jgi:hypothetical protein